MVRDGCPLVRRITDLVEATLPDVEKRDGDLAWRLRAILVLGDRSDQEILPAGRTLGEAVFMGHLVFARMRPDVSAAEIAGIAERAALQVDGLLEGSSRIAFTGMVLGLRWADRLESAERLLDRAIAIARRRGSTTDFGSAMTLRAAVHRRAGRLRDAEADARVALAAVLDPEWSFARGVVPLVGSLLDQGRVEQAERELAGVVGGGEIHDSPPMIPVLLARMWVRAARREHAQARDDWEEAVRRVSRLRGVNAGWIEDLTIVSDVHEALGARSAAETVAAQALELARRWDTPGAIGQALHAQARIAAPDESIEILHYANSERAMGPAAVTAAIGIARRHAGQPLGWLPAGRSLGRAKPERCLWCER